MGWETMSKSPISKSKVKLKGIGKGKAPGCIAAQIKPGEVRNPNGRPKGSRNKFAEEFLRDFLADWEKHGKKAIRNARQEDPVQYLKIAASLLPKDFNINVTDEAAVEKMLENFDDDQLEAIFAAIAAAGSTGKKDTVKEKVRTKPSSLH